MKRPWIPDALREEAYRYFGARCAYCHAPEGLVNAAFAIDHIVPASHGGATESSNLAYACSQCNQWKRDRTTGYDRITGREVVLFHPRRQQWSRHFEWSEDGTLILGLTACGRATVEALVLNHEYRVRLRKLWMLAGARPPEWIPPTALYDDAG